MKTERITEGATDFKQDSGNLPEEYMNKSRRRKPLIRDESLFNFILENSNLGYAVIDASGQFLQYNQLFLKLFDLSEESTIKNVNDQNWSEWQVYNEDFEILPVDEHPVRKAALTGRKVKNQLVGVKNPSGDSLTWMWISADPIRGEGGKTERIICTYQDITEQVAAREQLRKREELFRSVLDNSRDVKIRSNLQTGLYEYVSPSVEVLTGYSQEEFIGMDVRQALSMIHPDDLPVLQEAFSTAGKTGKAEVEYRLYTKNGDCKWASNHISVVSDSAGKPAFRISVIRDITQGKQAEQTLRESEQKLKYHFENSPLAIIEWDTLYKVLQWSKEAERIFGWKKEEVIGKGIDELKMVFEEDLPILIRTMERLSGGKERTVASSNRNYSKNGSIIYCNWYNSILTDNNGKMTSVLSLVEDFTERKQQELKLKESEEKYKELVENARSVIIKLDTEGRITFFNEYAEHLFGFTEEEIIGRNVIDTIVPKIDAEGTEMEPILEDLYKNPDHYQLNINENIKKNGERIWVEWHNRALFNNQGQRTGHIAIGVDITGRRQAEERLKYSEARYRRLFESARDGILILDADNGQIIDANPFISEMLGYAHEEFFGKQLKDIGLLQNADQTSASFTGLQQEGYIRYDDLPLKTKGGNSLHVEFVSNIYHVDDKKVIQCNIRDITDRKNSEQALIENERRLRELNASKDKFFSIVTHDLKSPFTSIVGFSELLEEKIRNRDYSEIEEFTSIINKASMRVMDLLKNLIEWSRLQTGRMEFNRKETDIVSVIGEVTELLYASARQKGIRITKQVPSKLNVMADKQMVSAVIRNLISNAIKFTKPGGNIHISAVSRPNDILVTVSDDGIGIKPEVMGKLFSIEGNISTRGTNREEGTGLGLVLCKEFIAKHGGDIWVEPEIPNGSRFMFTLPSGIKSELKRIKAN